MNDFERRLQEIKRADEEQKRQEEISRREWEAQRKLDEQHQRETLQKWKQEYEAGLRTVERILDQLNCKRMLQALKKYGYYKDHEGPIVYKSNWNEHVRAMERKFLSEEDKPHPHMRIYLLKEWTEQVIGPEPTMHTIENRFDSVGIEARFDNGKVYISIGNYNVIYEPSKHGSIQREIEEKVLQWVK